MRTLLAVLALAVSVGGALLVGGLGVDELGGAVLALRAHRAVDGVVVGSGLALSGVAMQCLLRNPLADPFLLGMSSGASLGAVCAVVFLGAGALVAPAAAAGALLAALLVAAVARDGRRLLPPTRLVLAGVAAAAVFASLTTLLLQLHPNEGTLRATLFWSSGALGGSPWSWSVAGAVLVAVSAAWLMLRARWMDRMLLGEETARSLGVPVGRFRPSLLFIAASLTGVCVAIAGLVGFIGLVGPHLARIVWGPTHRGLVVRSAVLGALVLVLADLASRVAFYPRELSVGVVTALVGGPVFIGLLRRATYSFGEVT